jgi:hypothetical protein
MISNGKAFTRSTASFVLPDAVGPIKKKIVGLTIAITLKIFSDIGIGR